MQVGMIGLGRMGANMVRRLMRGGHRCVVHDVWKEAVQVLVGEGALGAVSLDDFVTRLATPRIVWLMVPAAIVDATLDELSPRLAAGDVVVDGGNSYYRDDIERAKRLATRALHYVDCGTSGGGWGLERGYCLMIGGDADVVGRPDPPFPTPPPGAGPVGPPPGGRGPAGTGGEGDAPPAPRSRATRRSRASPGGCRTRARGAGRWMRPSTRPCRRTSSRPRSSSASPREARPTSRTVCSPPCGSSSAATARKGPAHERAALRRGRLLRGERRPRPQEDLPGPAGDDAARASRGAGRRGREVGVDARAVPGARPGEPRAARRRRRGGLLQAPRAAPLRPGGVRGSGHLRGAAPGARRRDTAAALSRDPAQPVRDRGPGARGLEP